MASDKDKEQDRPVHHLKPVSGAGGQVTVYDPHVSVPEDDDSIDLREYWRILVKRKWVVFGLLAIVLTATTMGTLLMVPEYRAEATVQIKPEGGRILAYEDFESSARGAAGNQQFLTTQYEILRSRSLAEAVVRREGLQDHPELTGEIRQRSVMGEMRELAGMLLAAIRPAAGGEHDVSDAAPSDPVRAAAKHLRDRIEVQPVRNSNLVQVSVVGFDREFSSRLANAVVREYIEGTMQRRYDAGSEARKFLQTQLDEMRIALERSDRALADFARDAHVSDLAENMEMARAGLRSLSERLDDVRNELVQLAGWRELVQQGRIDHLDPVANSATIADLQTRLLDASAEYASLSERFLDSYPTVAETLRRIELLRAEIAAEKQKIADGILGRFETLRAQEAALERAIAEREERIMAMNEQGVQYNILRREFETNQELYDGLLQRMKEIGVAAGIQENNISVIDEARTPAAPFKPVLGKNLAIASMLGLMVGIGLALLLEFLDSTIRRTEDVERLVDRPVLGLVPLVRPRERGGSRRKNSKGTDRSLSHYSAEHPQSSVSEAYRSLRTSLMFATPEGMPKVLLVTSASQSEGKSTTAANLATVLAQNGGRVLLIDADLRKPSLHRDFAKPRSPGLTNCIAQANQGRIVDGPAIHESDVDGLWLMLAGHSTPSPAELLSSSRLGKVLADCRQDLRPCRRGCAADPGISGCGDSVADRRRCDSGGGLGPDRKGELPGRDPAVEPGAGAGAGGRTQPSRPRKPRLRVLLVVLLQLRKQPGAAGCSEAGFEQGVLTSAARQ
ncbi:exopolysaccharide biosynthesis protein [Thioalkalivibrio nitratireducens DSM 14787]|uniref:Exopolysaccharide biosynthesis protein n=1 Tax=Thioalkalivibrio nitratireducens (strain DSM 14787 / UNIQEM 213 / ALEN2) TaxID=1255043 RepID=L0DVP5_THIND|nr:polysaccharide biosynthesis tyrosine autokinase [Thioalkalivibrio nitratireducens]AGA33055.1 exopolysaccharide biosynthesis protein [Thioalkalivibrio nitratireducens DSM 14787]